jgi:prevent-host-death family protein
MYNQHQLVDICPMATYSVAEARNRIADLIDRALAGEDVAITRRGRRVVDVVPSRNEGAPMDLDWIRGQRVDLERPEPNDGMGVVERLRRNGEL